MRLAPERIDVSAALPSAPEEIRTSRLKLRRWKDSDLGAFAAMNADPAVMEHFPSVLTRAESDALAKRIREHLGVHGFGLWAVELASRASFVGFVGLAHTRFSEHFTPCIDLGWRLAREHWGKGYATEAAHAVMRFGFECLGLDEIVAFTVPDNVRSRRVMDVLGMRHDAAGDFEHPHVPMGHRLRRHVLYRLPRPPVPASPHR
jgi:ribosomal-protein-alanine N-acetyltransferase